MLSITEEGRDGFKYRLGQDRPALGKKAVWPAAVEYLKGEQDSRRTIKGEVHEG